MMGGRIWVESAVGQGSTFHFTARFTSACLHADVQGGPVYLQGRDGRGTTAAPISLAGRPVLIVDDNATNRRILLELLGNWKMRPTAVDSGAAALAALQQATSAAEPPHLILLDAHMPDKDGFTVAREIKDNPAWAAIRVVMLTSAGQPGDVSSCRQLGIDSYAMKPLKQSELLQVILTALSSREPKAKSGEPVALPSGSPLLTQGPGPKALLVEDNVVNQVLATRLLEKQGFAVVVAGNGKEALAALERQPFDLVLMDVQMPEMNGLEATRLIRQMEAGTERHLPILAMTAHAMKGDRERCLEVGMDGYVSKPIQPRELVEAIVAVMEDRGLVIGEKTKTPTSSPITNHQSPITTKAVLNWEEALQRVGGDVGLLREVAQLFLDTCSKQLVDLESALRRGDWAAVQVTAHALKGSVSIFGATAAFEAALRVENLARLGELNQAEAAWAALQEAIARLLAALRDKVTR